jgi:hypothetical protein
LNDEFGRGFLYGYKRKIAPERLLEKILKYTGDSANPEVMRLSLMTNYFSVEPTPEEWLTLTPLTDDLPPDRFLYSYYLKNWRRSVQNRASPDWPPDLFKALSDFTKRKDSADSRRIYARDVLRWTQLNPTASVRFVRAHALLRMISDEISNVAGEFRNPAAERILNYFRGLDKELSASAAIGFLDRAMSRE